MLMISIKNDVIYSHDTQCYVWATGVMFYEQSSGRTPGLF